MSAEEMDPAKRPEYAGEFAIEREFQAIREMAMNLLLDVPEQEWQGHYWQNDQGTNLQVVISKDEHEKTNFRGVILEHADDGGAEHNILTFLHPEEPYENPHQDLEKADEVIKELLGLDDTLDSFQAEFLTELRRYIVAYQKNLPHNSNIDEVDRRQRMLLNSVDRLISEHPTCHFLFSNYELVHDKKHIELQLKTNLEAEQFDGAISVELKIQVMDSEDDRHYYLEAADDNPIVGEYLEAVLDGESVTMRTEISPNDQKLKNAKVLYQLISRRISSTLEDISVARIGAHVPDVIFDIEAFQNPGDIVEQ